MGFSKVLSSRVLQPPKMTTEPFQKVSSSWFFRNSFVVVGISFLVLSSWVSVKRIIFEGVATLQFIYIQIVTVINILIVVGEILLINWSSI